MREQAKRALVRSVHDAQRLRIRLRSPTLRQTSIQAIRTDLDRIMASTENHWLRRAARPDAGYAIDEVGRGEYTYPSIFVLRTLWTYAHLHRHRPHEALAHALAEGWKVFETRLWDSRHGGVLRAGESDVPGWDMKHAYVQLMAVDALLALQATGAEIVGTRLADLLDILDRHFFAADGHLPESLDRDFTVVPEGPGLQHPDPKIITSSTHVNALHIMAGVHATGVADRTDTIRSLIDIIEHRALAPGSRHMLVHITGDWRPVSDQPEVSYGHELERVWMGRHAAAAIGDDPDARLDLHVDLYRSIARWARLPGGGFAFAGPPEAPPRNLCRIWWVQAEALLCELELWSATGDARYLDAAGTTAKWIRRRQLDPEGGEWRYTIDVFGRSRERLISEWKSGYHTVRALLQARQGLIRQEPTQG